jgi:hypothetical protein
MHLERMIDRVAKRLGFVRLSAVRMQLNYGYSVAKRLDEHREVVEGIVAQTTLFEQYPWHASHMATQDDYLVRLFRMVHGCWPDDEVEHGYSPTDLAMLSGARLPPSQLPRRITPEIRPRPAVLGACALPEYPSNADMPTQSWPNVVDASREAKGADSLLGGRFP